VNYIIIVFLAKKKKKCYLKESLETKIIFISAEREITK